REQAPSPQKASPSLFPLRAPTCYQTPQCGAEPRFHNLAASFQDSPFRNFIGLENRSKSGLSAIPNVIPKHILNKLAA
ncbi:hypothetical protein, partial [Pseudomonas tehranensis]|uniref:hypothetical protein n=1 Tax=Pseudomonas tehranensis TaxID=2745502 RepID=UPI001CD88E71